MLTNTDVMKFLAVWELLHESADEALKAGIARGEDTTQGEMNADKGAFVDGLAAMVNARKDILKAELAAGSDESLEKDEGPAAEAVAELRFEVAELRGRLESMNATLDALATKL
ncbi:MAG: hypothetical protein FWF45_00440 [Coriobacteriia bacterium]|nr:hypothetical protein [Coriobacteriia bacterium]